MGLDNYEIIVIGCGLSGIVIAERFSLLQNKKVLIIDKRNHIGGNCYDYYDEKTNILINKYGAHLFHTNHEEVFEYINQYGNWSHWEHKVLGLIDDKHLPIPANITTVNEIFNLDIKNKEEMDEWLSENQVKYENITNSEEMAKSRVGEVLYEKIFKHYTYKQWKKYPNELAPEVLARIPVRNSFDDRYFSDKYQVLPEKGYTAFFQSILDKHKDNIDMKLNCDFFDIKDEITKDHIVIYTGPIDAYFADKGLPKLEYISIDFHIECQMNTESYQPYSVVNYLSADTPYTRCVEYKHFLKQESDHTIYVKETTNDIGEPYYPVLNDRNKELYEKYQKMAEEERENIHFLGRLASYKYFNMDQAIKNSLDYYEEHFKNKEKKITLIISRYKENIDWIEMIKKSRLIEKILVFNKGPHDIYFDKAKSDIINVENIGREGGTYLDYIINNYYNLPDNLVFTQANPFDHNENFLDFFKDESIKLYIDKDILNLTTHFSENENIPPQSFVRYNNSYNVSNLKSVKYFISSSNYQVVGHSAFYDNGMVGQGLSIKDICKLIGIEEPKNIIPFCFSACFFVKSKQIVRHSKEIYIKLREYLYNSNEQGGNEGYHLERLWYYLLTGESYYTLNDCLNELFTDSEPIIKIFCDKRKRVWFKNINNCTTIVENPNTYIIYTKNGMQKILPGVDYVGPDLLYNQCSDLEQAKNLNFHTNFGNKVVKSDNFLIGNASFEVFKKNGVLNFIDNGGWESRNTSTIWCMQQANKLYKWNDFDKIVISTDDSENNSADYSYSHQEDINKTIPDFNFHAWKEVGINDYSDLIDDIHLSGLKSPEINKVGWIGSVNFHNLRNKFYDIGQKNNDCMEIMSMKWNSSNNIESNSTKYISIPDLVKKYAILIDIEGAGYSGRVKHLLWSHRPLIIIDRSHKEYFYKYLEPWKHFIPVKRDLSDLVTNIKWCLQNKNEAKKIAENAYEFSKKYLTRRACYYRWNEIIGNEIKKTEFNSQPEKDTNVNELPKNIFLLWFQGWDTAPWLQRQVRKSWETNNPDWNIILLDESNLRNYINDIDYIYDKRKNITYQAKSDIVRLSLLKNIGGVWADSTLLCMQPLDNWVEEAVNHSGFWMYHGRGAGMSKEIGPASWFIVSKKENYILKKWKEKCDEYWRNHQNADNYFWMDHLFKNLHNTDYRLRDLWSKVPYLYCEDKGSAHTLAPSNGSGMEMSDEELKKTFTKSPPYVLKLWNDFNQILDQEHCINSNGYYAIQLAINRNLVLKNTDPIIKIFCNKRKTIWFKYINNCHNLHENPNTQIIYTRKGEQKIFPGLDYVGPDLFYKYCSDLEQAKNLTFTDDINPIIKIFCNKRKTIWFKYINNCHDLHENPNTQIIYTRKGEQKIFTGLDYIGPDLFYEYCSDLEKAKNLTFTDNTKFYFYIRGHIRNSFNTDQLKNFIKLLKSHFKNIKFIIQTWKHKECKNNESWRQINEDKTEISKQMIENYFEDDTITKQCLIIDEKSIELIGSTNGTIGLGPCPKQGWKNMWYGIYKGLEHLDINSFNDVIVSFRFDYFLINQSKGINENKIIKFIKNNLDNEYIQFIKYDEHGTDNLYMGRYNKIKALVDKFHFKLDDILNMNKEIICQEYLVNIIAKQYMINSL